MKMYTASPVESSKGGARSAILQGERIPRSPAGERDCGVSERILLRWRSSLHFEDSLSRFSGTAGSFNWCREDTKMVVPRAAQALAPRAGQSRGTRGISRRI